jgi:cell division protein FtsA
VVLVDIGGGTTDIAIFKNKKIQHTAVIPFGGNIITEDICTGCSIIKHYAEEVKVKFGSALASENRDDEVVSIPGIRGREPKEISFKNLAHIIQARLEEIFELVNYEIQKAKTDNQLIAGIVLTGGGALMKHIQQLAEFKTGLEVRIGYPNEHLNQNTMKEMSSPMYSTGIGIVIETIARMEHDEFLRATKEAEKAKEMVPVFGTPEVPADAPTDDTTESTDDNSGKKKKKKNFDVKSIIATITDIFVPDDID